MKKTVYMLVTEDELELPIIIEDTVKGLAEKLNVKPESISKELSRSKSEKGLKRCKYKKITINVDKKGGL